MTVPAPVTPADHESWLTANWRPIAMLAFVMVVVYEFVIAQAFALPHVEEFPDRLWGLLEIGFGSYVTGRSLEKIAPHVAEAIAAVKGAPPPPGPATA